MFDIPELDDLIYWRLERHELAHCARVNKKWHAIVIPYLWHEVNPFTQQDGFRKLVAEDYFHEQWQQLTQKGEQGTNQHILTPSSPFSSSLSKYCHLIRTTPGPDELLSCFRQPPHIKSRDLRKIVPGMKSPTPDELLRHFYKRCHNTVIQVDSVRLSNNDFTNSLWNTIPEDATLRVRRLCVDAWLNRKVHSWKLKKFLDRFSTSMETLILNVDIEYGEDDGKEVETKTWTSLRELELQECRDTSEARSFWPWLWTRCRQVERLKVATFNDSVVQSLADAMPTHMSNLDTIHLRKYYDFQESTNKLIAKLLPGSRKGWKVVNVSDSWYFGKDTVRLLTRHFPTLVELRVDGCKGFTGDDLVQVLISCPNLCKLITTNDGHYSIDFEFPCIKASAFIDRDPGTGTLRTWPCERSLKILAITIGGIPRPDLTSCYTAIQETYPGQGREIQKLVYERLGRLTKLETLHLGHDPKVDEYDEDNEDNEDNEAPVYDERSFQDDCLEMSLESGLDKLSSLKSLRELNVSRMERRKGIENVRWMAENWPQLSTIRGLDRFGEDKEDVRWLKEHFPEIDTPRPDDY